MKTLHVTNAWHETSGGVATFYRALMAAAERRGQQMVMVVPGAEDEIERNGTTRIYRVKARPSPLNADYRSIKPPAYLYSGSRLQEILNEERPDLVEICDKYYLNYLGALLRVGLLSGVPFRPTVVGMSCERMDDNFAVYVRGGISGKAFSRRYMQYLYFPFFDHHIVNSTHTGEELLAVSKGHPVRRGIWRLPMGVDLSSFSPALRTAEGRAALLARVGIAEPCKLLVYAGRLAPEKNLGLLLEMMRRLEGEPENFHLLIAGDGIGRAEMERQAALMTARRVHFLGYVGERNELAQLMANSDVFVHPNPREPFGITPLEAMASGLPLVAPDTGGVTEYANAENAYVGPATGDVYAEAVLECVRDGELRRKKVERALATAHGYGWEPVTDAFLDLYDVIHAVTQGERSLDSAGAWACSAPPSRMGGNIFRGVAELSKAGFRQYIRVRSAIEKRAESKLADVASGAD